MKYELKTKNGYDFFECSSAMQKSIRRGLEEDALFWAVELYESNYAEYVWKRLRIISSEDIGLSEANISSEIWALYEMHREQAKKKEDTNRPQRLFVIHAILKLCRATKNRTVDWALIYHFECHQNLLRKVPDYAYDKHNDKGKKLGRGWGHFFEEGTFLEQNPVIISEEQYKELAKKAVNKTCGKGLFD